MATVVRWVVLAFVVWMWLAYSLRAQQGYTLATGSFHASETEQVECYFAIGPGASLALHPKGEPCQIARELIGRTGRLVFTPD